MTRRPLVRPLWFDDEPASSYVARWADQCGHATADTFANELGLDRTEVLAGRANAEVARFADLPADAFDASTPTLKGSLVSVRGMTVSATHWNPIPRQVCPACLADDALASTRPGYGHVRVRTWWHLRFIEACPVHERELVSLGTAGNAWRSVAATSRLHALEPGTKASPEECGLASYVLGHLGFGDRVRLELTADLGDRDAISLLLALSGSTVKGNMVAAYAALAGGRGALERRLDDMAWKARRREGRSIYRGSIESWIAARGDAPSLVSEVVRCHADENGLAELSGPTRAHAVACTGAADPSLLSPLAALRNTNLDASVATSVLRVLRAVGLACGPDVPFLDPVAARSFAEAAEALVGPIGVSGHANARLRRLREDVDAVPGAKPGMLATAPLRVVDVSALVRAKRRLRSGRFTDDVYTKGVRALRRLLPELKETYLAAILEGRVEPIGVCRGGGHDLLDLRVVLPGCIRSHGGLGFQPSLKYSIRE